MPKITNYPSSSLKNALVLADAVNSLGGECSADMSADKLGKQVTSGAFKSLVSGTVKYGLITSSKGQLSVSQLYRDIELAYNEEDAQKERQKSFLSPPLFTSIFNRFEKKTLPVSHFEKLLIREFGVPDNVASKVSFYFKEGAKQTGLLDDNDVLSQSMNDEASPLEEETVEIINENQKIQASSTSTIVHQAVMHTPANNIEDDAYSVRITGPGIDSLITIKEEEDLYIVEAMLKKVKKRIAQSDKKWDE